MRPTAGRWVSGDDFFDREPELRVLESHVRDHNHLLLTGQRRMGKTSIARELGRRLQAKGWISLFADVEGSTCAEDAVATIAKATYPVRSIVFRFGSGLKHWVAENIEEVGGHGFRAKIRGGLNEGNWRRLGEKLLQSCAAQDEPVVLVIDELPIFLKRMLHDDGEGLTIENGVAEAVYETLGLGIPHHVQSFFARIRDFATMSGTSAVTVADVDTVYRTGLLGPFGQNDLVHYETRLKDGLDDETFSIAMEILAEAATQDVFTRRARRCLEDVYETLVDDVRVRVADTIEVLVHDGYIEADEGGHRFPSRLLCDWWAARFRDHHEPLESRCADLTREDQAR